jgi:hypothetical protein
MKPCPFCDAEIAAEAVRCPACGGKVAAYEKATRWLDRVFPPPAPPKNPVVALVALLWGALVIAGAITLLGFGFTGRFFDSLGMGIGGAAILLVLGLSAWLIVRHAKRRKGNRE